MKRNLIHICSQGDPEKPTVTSGIRIGTPAATTRGFGRPEMIQLAGWIQDTIVDFEKKKTDILAQVKALCAKYPVYH